MQETLVKEITARSPVDLLIKVYETGKNSALKILLKSGVFIEGFIIHLSEKDGIYQDVCFLLEDKTIGFFNLSEISLVCVKQPKLLAVELSDGAISRPLNEGERCTSLQLKRWLLKQESKYDNRLKLMVPDNLSDENQRLNIKDAIGALTEAINRICKDDLGKSAWTEITTVQIIYSDEKIFLKKYDGRITVHINYKKALPSQLAEILEEKLLNTL
ncbi:hypothetical protein MQE36_11510 [Zhouia spongiae]|uniref:DUF4388 domain-containing protein n=1 Tax=Zhouia spongiae TaxID=2202721 RepID=A0ABY3YIN4_9FLAO|nr:hypothetical protein [Zhouia spongiae]UNY97710.1 hypothetical protein MQE36_11510 [Zhouia spongiae]